jgi:uncharacterized protein (TIGR03083 family)
VSLSSDQQLDAIRTEGSRFWDTIDAATDLEARVPSCPDWNVGDLARHLAGVHAFWTQIVDPEAVSNDRPIDTIALVGLGREALQRMVDVLASADPQQHVWTWASQQDVAFVTRHQVQEAAVHRWDAQTAAGADVDPIAPDAAADAIDEFLILARPALTSTASGSSTPTAGSSRSMPKATSRSEARRPTCCSRSTAASRSTTSTSSATALSPPRSSTSTSGSTPSELRVAVAPIGATAHQHSSEWVSAGGRGGVHR